MWLSCLSVRAESRGWTVKGASGGAVVTDGPLVPVHSRVEMSLRGFQRVFRFCRHQTRTLRGISVYRDSVYCESVNESAVPPGGWVW